MLRLLNREDTLRINPFFAADLLAQQDSMYEHRDGVERDKFERPRVSTTDAQYCVLTFRRANLRRHATALARSLCQTTERLSLGPLHTLPLFPVAWLDQKRRCNTSPPQFLSSTTRAAFTTSHCQHGNLHMSFYGESFQLQFLAAAFAEGFEVDIPSNCLNNSHDWEGIPGRRLW